MPSEIHYLRDSTARNDSLDMWQPEMWRTYLECVFIGEKSNPKKRIFHQTAKFEIVTPKSP